MGTEEIYVCPRCKETESYMYNDFDEVVAYVHCPCKKPKKPDLINGMKPMDYAFAQIDKMIEKELIKLKQRKGN